MEELALSLRLQPTILVRSEFHDTPTRSTLCAARASCATIFLHSANAGSSRRGAGALLLQGPHAAHRGARPAANECNNVSRQDGHTQTRRDTCLTRRPACAVQNNHYIYH